MKWLVEMHGGSVTAASDGPGRGSEFTVRLPRGTVAPASPPAAAVPAGRRRVPIADDNFDMARSMAALIELMGHDGVAAVREAERFRPDVVLTDIGMPGQDGHAAARAVRALSWGGGVRLVAVTGWGQDGDRQRTAAAGFDRHLTKPVDPTDLVRLLAEA